MMLRNISSTPWMQSPWENSILDIVRHEDWQWLEKMHNTRERLVEELRPYYRNATTREDYAEIHHKYAPPLLKEWGMEELFDYDCYLAYDDRVENMWDCAKKYGYTGKDDHIGTFFLSSGAAGSLAVLAGLGLPTLVETFGQSLDEVDPTIFEVNWEAALEQVCHSYSLLKSLPQRYTLLHKSYFNTLPATDLAAEITELYEHMKGLGADTVSPEYHRGGVIDFRGVRVWCSVGDWLLVSSRKDLLSIRDHTRILGRVKESIELVLSTPEPEKWRMSLR